MANLVRYYFRKLGANFVDFKLDYPSNNLSLIGSDVVYVGSSGVDRVYVAKGVKFTFNNSGTGTDEIYLDGSFADYSLTAIGTSTLLLTSTAKANTSITLASEDKVFFSDGSSGVKSLITYAAARIGTPSTPLPTLNTTENSLTLPSTNNLDSILRAYTKDPAGVVFAQPHAGVEFILTGHNGVDKVYVSKGGKVNANNLGTGVDLIYLTGSKNEYSPTAVGTSVLVLTKGTERVTLASEDRVIFADGSTLVKAAITAASGANWQALSLDSNTRTPGLVTDTQAPAMPTLALGAGVSDGTTAAEATAATGVVSVLAESGSTVLLTFSDSASPVHTLVKTLTGNGSAQSVQLDSTDIGTNIGTGPASLQDGSITISATATDAAGNTSSAGTASFTLDTAKPDAPVFALVAGVATGATSAEAEAGAVTVNAELGSSVAVTFTDSNSHSVIKMLTGSGSAQNVMLDSSDIGSGANQLQDGSITVSANATDAAGNTSMAGNSSFTLDTAKPDAPVFALVAGVATGATSAEALAGAVTVNAELGSSVAVTFTDSNSHSVIKMLTGSGSAQNVMLDSSDIGSGSTQLQDGSITVSANATDAAGNTSMAGSSSFTLDTAKPDAPVFALVAGVATGATSAEALAGAVTVNAELGSSVAVTFTDSNSHSVIKMLNGTGSALTVTLDSSDIGSGASQLQDGSITVSANATDAAGNTSMAGSSSFTLDTAKPDAPVFALVAGVATGATSAEAQAGAVTVNAELGSSVAVTFTDSNSHSVIKMLTGSGSAQNVMLDSSDIGSGANQLQDGSITVSANATDAAGNTSMAGNSSFTLDTAKPVAPVFALVAGVATGATSAEAEAGAVTVNAELGSSVAVTFTDSNSHSVIKMLTGSGSALAVTLDSSDIGSGSTQLLDGSITVSANATDAAGNTSMAGNSSFTLDTAKPVAPVFALVAGVATGATSAEAEAGAVTVNAELGSSVAVTFTDSNSHSVIKMLTGSGSAQNVMLDSSDIGSGANQLQDGSITVSANATDAAGNTSMAGSSSFTLDTAKPVAPIFALVAGVATGATSAEAQAGAVTVNAELGSSVAVTFTDSNSHSIIKMLTGSGSAQNVMLDSSDIGSGSTQLQDGSITVSANATDAAGNTSMAGNSSFTLDTAKPVAPVFALVAGVATGATSAEAQAGAVTVNAELGSSVAVTFTDSNSHSVIKLLTGTGSALTVTLDSSDIGSGANQLQDGSITVSANATDAAGNSSMAGNSSFTLDTAKPDAPVFALVAGVATGATSAEAQAGAVTVNAELGSSVAVTFTDSNSHSVIKMLTGSGSAQNVMLDSSDIGSGASQLQDGSITVSANATDAAGNTSMAGSSSFTLDTAKPDAPVFALGAGVSDGATSAEATAGSGAVTVNAELGSSVAVTFSDSASHSVIKMLTGSGSAQNVMLDSSDIGSGANQLQDGSITVSANATDAAGNTSMAGNSSFTLDTAKPVAPVFALVAGVATGATSAEALAGAVTVNAELGSSVAVTFTDSNSHSVIKMLTGSGSAQNVMLDSSDIGSGANQLQDGSITVSANATDAAGNTSMAGNSSFTLDTAKPDAPVFALVAGVATGATSAEALAGAVTVNAELGSSVAVTFTDSASHSVIKMLIGSGSALAVTLDSSDIGSGASQLQDGSITVSANATDAAGNTSMAGNSSFTLDTAKPVAPVFALVAGVATGATSAEAEAGAVTVNAELGSSVAVTFTDSNSHSVIKMLTGSGSAQNVMLDSSDIGSGASQLQDGSITISATATDAAGNTSTAGTASFTLDTAKPDAPVFALVAGVATGATSAEALAGAVTVNAELGSSVAVTFSDSASHSVIKMLTGSGSAQNVMLDSSDIGSGSTQLQDGSITVSATATDAAGNTSTAGSSSFTLDTAKPVAPIFALVAGVATGATSAEAEAGAVTVNAELGSSVAVTFTDSNSHSVIKMLTGSGSALAVTLDSSDIGSGASQLQDGSITVSANATDAAGNTSMAGNSSFTLDTAKPDAPVFALVAGVATGATSAEAQAGAVTVNAELGSSVAVTFTDSNSHSVIKMLTGSGSAQNVMLDSSDIGSGASQLQDGSITVSANATDAAGNTSTAGNSSFTLDTAKPDAPVFALVAGVATGATSAEAQAGAVTVNAELGSSVAVTFTDSNSHSVIKMLTGSGSAQNVMLDSSDIGSGANQLQDGSITVSANATDAAGNTSMAGSSSFTLDTHAPAAPVLAQGSGVSDGATAAEATAGSGVVTVNAELGSSVAVTFTDSNSHSVIKMLTGSGSALAVTLDSSDIGSDTAMLQDGRISVSATATDAAGNTSLAGNSSFTLDSTAPGAPSVELRTGIFSGATAAEATAPNGLLTVTAESGSTVLVTFGERLNGTDIAASAHSVVKTMIGTGSAQSVALDSSDIGSGAGQLQDGYISIIATATDAAGNTSGWGGDAFLLDTQAPTTPSFSTHARITDEPTAGVLTLDIDLNILNIGDENEELKIVRNSDGSYNIYVQGEPTPELDHVSLQAVIATISELNSSVIYNDGILSLLENLTTPGRQMLASVTAEGDSIKIITFTDSLNHSVSKTVVGLGSNAVRAVNVSLLPSDWGTGVNQLTDGNIGVSVLSTDIAGNVSMASSGSFTLDTVKPDAPVFALSAGVTSGATSAEALAGAVTVNAELGSSVAVTFSDSASHSVIKMLTGSGSAQNVMLDSSDIGSGASQLQDGSITISATATDAAGNTSTAGTASFTLDTAKPDAPVFALVAGVATGATSAEALAGAVTVNAELGSSVAVTFTDSNSHSVIKMLTGSGSALAVTLDSSDIGSGSTQLQDGSITVSANATDAAGNTSMAGNSSFTLDTAKPVAPVFALVAGVATGATSVEALAGAVTVNAELGSSVAVTFSDSASHSVIKMLTGSGSAQNVMLDSSDIGSGASQLQDGSITVSANATDATGNTSMAGSSSFTLDTHAPAAPVLAQGSGVSDGATAAEATAGSGVVTVNAELGSSVAVTFTDSNSHSVIKMLTGSGSALAVTLDSSDIGSDTAMLQDGRISVSATATDAAGNTSLAGSGSFTLDSTAPGAPSVELRTGIFSGATAAEATAPNGLLTVTAESGSTVLVTFGESLNGTDIAASAHSVVKTMIGTGSAQSVALDSSDIGSGAGQLQNGYIVAIATVTDAAGNTSEWRSAAFPLDTQAPTTPSFSTHARITDEPTAGVLTLDADLKIVNIGDENEELKIVRNSDGSYNLLQGEPTPVLDHVGLQAVIATISEIDSSALGRDDLISLLESLAIPGRQMLASVTAEGDSTKIITFTDSLNHSVSKTVVGLGSNAVRAVNVSLLPSDWGTGVNQLTDGNIGVSVLSTDIAGNVSMASSGSFTLDTVKPDAPVFALVAGVATGATSAEALAGAVTVNAELGSSVAVTFTDSNSHSVIKMLTGSGSAQNVMLDSSDIGSGANQLQDGSITVSANATDATGNTSMAGNSSFTLDTAKPDAPVFALVAGVATGATSAEAQAGAVTVNAELGSSVAVTFTDSNSHSVIKMLTGSGSAQNVMLDSSDIGSGASQLQDGSITVSANATDAAGNSSMAGNSSFTLDTHAPSINSSATLGVNENTTTVATLAATDSISSGGLAWSLESGGTDNALFNIDPSSGVLSFKHVPNYEDATRPAHAYSVKVGVTDAAGNLQTHAITVNVSDVNEAPTVNAIAPANLVFFTGANTISLNLNEVFSDEDVGDTLSYSLDNGPLPTGLTLSNGVIGGTPAANATGGSFIFSANDGHGHTVSTTIQIEVATKPKVSSIAVFDSGTGSMAEAGKQGDMVMLDLTLNETVNFSVMPNSSNLLASFTAGGAALTGISFVSQTFFGGKTVLRFSGTLPSGNASSVVLTSLTLNGGLTLTGNTSHQNMDASQTGLDISDSYMLDNTAPAAPTSVALAADTGNSTDGITMNRNVNVTLDEAGGTWEYSTDSGATWTAGSGSSFMLASNQIYAANAIKVRQTDAAGNVGTSGGIATAVTVDNAAPSITSGAIANPITENSGAAQVVYTTWASDQGAITYTLKANTGDDSAFSIDSSTGAVTLTANPNYETKSSYSFTVVATDAAGNNTEKPVTLAITNVDEVGPVFSSSATATAIAENSSAGQAVYNAAATDSDFNAPATASSVTYSLKANTGDANAFSIDSSTGVVTLTANPDYETKSSYSFTVVATDAAGNNTEKPVTLAITNVDEVGPVFSSSATATAIAENSGAGQAVYNAAATDSDFNAPATANSVTYTLKANTGDASAFSINSSTGAVTLTANPDFETKSSYSFTVVATDAAGNNTEKPVTLAITNVDEVGPVFSSSATATAIAENSSAGQAVYNAAATDSDFNAPATASSVTYTLKANTGDDSAFSIDSSTGAVTLTANPNYETKSSYSFTVVATDAAGNNTEKPVTLAISNVDEVGPVFSSSATATAIAENSGAGQVVYTAAATDSDFNSPNTASSVTYSLKANTGDASDFSINSSTGVVTLTANPDFETKSSYSFTVVATDAAGNNTEKPVTLAITNVDEVAPVFSSSATATAIAENSGTAQMVYTAIASDTDFISPNTANSVTYTLKANTGDDSAFSIDSSTGAVTLTANPNYETKSSYSFTVVATDAAGNNTEKPVTLAITNVDEVAPVFSSSGTATAIAENSGAGQAVYNAAATDSDFNAPATASSVTYTLKANTGDASAFSINSSTGVVTLTANPDFETKSSYSFTVVATDAAGNNTEKPVTLAITNVDEVGPVFSSSATATAIAENSSAGQAVYNAAATDSDFNAPATANSVTYTLKANTGDASAFSINSSTGVVTLTANPDFETKSSYSFTVVATDAAGNNTEKPVTLAITNVDEVGPVFSSSATATAIAENSGAAQMVYTAIASDTDFISPNTANSVTYTLKANTGDDSAFSIDSSTGAVTLTANPNYETKSSYSFTVVATDAAGNNTEKPVTLAITNVDEVAPVFSSSGTATAIAENSGAGQAVYNAAATDSDFNAPATASSVTYTLKANTGDASAFSINNSTGVVTLTASPDFETKSSYSFTVVATDAAGNNTEKPVTLAISNVDEVAPTFSSGSTATAIAENSGAAQMVYTAIASDTDFISPNTANSVTYTLKANTGDASAFSINSGTGGVTLTASPDFETKSSYSFTVVATDAAGNNTEKPVTLAISNVDEVAPTFSSGSTATAIAENSGAAQMVYTAIASDTDFISPNTANSVTYTLKANTGDASAFSINSGTGVVTLTASPDFETKSSYSFTVVATDAAGNNTEKPVTLAITNVDEVGPVFSSSGTATAIAENSGAAQEVYTAAATDSDFNSPNTANSVTYSLKANTGDASAFSINSSTGAVTLTANPDFETKSSYSFTVVATDAAGNNTEKPVTLAITNVDEVAPVFSSSGTATAIAENSGAAQEVYTAAATDSDFNSPNTASSVTYTLKANTGDASAFSINNSTGVVTLTASPDFETKSSYSFTVVATDAAGNNTEKPVTLAITNVDEVGPVFSSSATATAIAENSGAGQVVYTAAATDSDFNSPNTANSISYSLKANTGDASAFSINSGTGGVTLTASPDFETKSSYSFTVVATDAAGNNTEKPVTLAITNVDEVGPVFSSSATATAIAENSGAGQVVYTAAATDSDFNSPNTASSVTYSLKANTGDASAFSINSGTGVVTLTASPDFETKSSYSFTVVATDAAGNNTEKPVTLAITNVDEVGPVFSSSGTATAIAENSGAAQEVYTAAATDSDFNSPNTANSVTYSLKANTGDASAFSINSSTGAVTLTANPDFETKSSYSFTVVATDAAGNNTEKPVTLAITNVDEVAPVFSSSGTATAIAENSGAAQEVYTAAATDSDFNSPNTASSVTYTLKANTGDASAFSINNSTGVVTLTASPDFETKSSYSFTVVATDAAGNNTEKPVTLAISNVDEVAPTFSSGSTATAIAENSGAAQMVYTAIASDTDFISPNTANSVTYTLKANTGDASAFSINSGTGGVTLTASPDFETKSSYSFTVVATDAAGNNTEKPVTLAITNVDEVGPVFSSSATATAIAENSSAGQVVYTAAATDSDFNSPNTASSVTYSLKVNTGDASAFSINSSTGAVTLTASPDFETKSSYSFTVVATDAAGNNTEKPVTLAISNVDEVAPIFSSGSTATAIAENSGAGQAVYTAAATDSDFNAPATASSVTYTLKANTGDASAFSINSSTGVVTLTANPDFETKSSYSFTVIATDAAGNSAEKTVTLAIANVDVLAPTITSSGTATAIAENSGPGRVVYTATATDTDFAPAAASTITYSLKAGVGDASLFSINSSTGAVTLTANPDFETKSSYSFTVVATDAAGNNTEKPVTLAISNVDEVAPVFSSSATATAIAENSGAGQAVYNAAATDSDFNAPATASSVTYTLKANTGDDSAFSIDSSTGAVTLTANPNYETKSSYSFTVVATDAAGNQKLQVVSLAITDANDAPVNSVPSSALSAISGINKKIIGISVSDEDENFGENSVQLSVAHGTLSLSNPDLGFDLAVIVGNNSAEVSISGSQSAINAVLGTLNYTSDAGYSGTDTLTVLTTDLGTPALTDSDDIMINVGTGIGAGNASPISLSTALTDPASADKALDVTSELVFSLPASFSGTLAAGTGNITITDNGHRDGAASGYAGENAVHSFTIPVMVNGALNPLITISGSGASTKIIISPDAYFDFDLAANYSVSIPAGAFVSDGNNSAAITANFHTVSPGTVTENVNQDLSHTGTFSGNLSYTMDHADGSLLAGNRWVAMDGLGVSDLGFSNQTYSVALDLSGGNYTLVMRDSSALGTDLDAGVTGITPSTANGAAGDLSVVLQNFGVDDRVYVDDQFHLAAQGNDLAAVSTNGDGNGTEATPYVINLDTGHMEFVYASGGSPTNYIIGG